MTDRERLEIIKDKQMQMYELSTFDNNWLIEQAERAQELEEQLQGMHIMYDTRLAKSDEFEKQNKRYREALLKMNDYDIELGDMREDLQEKLLQIKYIKDKALEESE